MSRDPHEPMNPWQRESFAATPARRGLDLLLAAHPHFDLLSLDWQIDPSDGRSVDRWSGSWLLVELGQPSEQIELEPVWARWRFAIWRATGDVYNVDVDGAVGDDPILRGPGGR